MSLRTFNLGVISSGGGNPSWTPLDGFDQSGSVLYAYNLAGSDGELYSSGRVTSTPDLSGNGNIQVVPPLVVGAQGPVYEPTGFHGRPCWRFTPADSTALIRSAFNFGGSDASAMTMIFWVQKTNITSSTTIGGYQNNRPFFRTFNVDSVSWAASSTPATPGTQVTDAAMGPSCFLVDFDDSADLQSMWRDDGNGGMVQIAQTANTNPFVQIHGGSFGLGYSGHPTNAFASGYDGRIRCFAAIRGILTNAEKQRVGAWFARDAAPMRGPIVFAHIGQSVDMADGISNFYRYAARRDILSRRHNATISGPTEYDYPWGPLNNTYNTGSVRGYDWECCTQLADTYRIRHHLFNVARSGTGFFTSGGTPDPDGWIPSSQNGGTPGALITRLFNTIDATRAAHPEATEALEFWMVIGHKETDSITSAAANAYLTNISALVSEISAHYPSDSFRWLIPLVHPSLNFAHTATVRAAQEAFVAQTENAFSINCDDQSLRIDLVHPDTNYHIAMGQRMAAIIDANTNT